MSQNDEQMDAEVSELNNTLLLARGLRLVLRKRPFYSWVASREQFELKRSQQPRVLEEAPLLEARSRAAPKRFEEDLDASGSGQQFGDTHEI